MISLDLNEYLVYILLYTANADFEISGEELDLIRKNIDREDFKRIKNAFDAAGDADRLEVILHYKAPYLHVLMDSAALEMKMKEVLMADGRYPSVERAINTFLHRLLNS